MNQRKPKSKWEKAILVGVCAGRTRLWEAQSHLDELERLADTAEALVVGRVLQRMPTLNPATLIGSGKLQEIKDLCEMQEVNMVIFDDELTPSQLRNIEKILTDIKILDRTNLILDIFAMHARTAESKLMVEIAQLEYTSSRLTRMWTHLCRQVGGIGTRGPGETQIEVDRRVIKSRVAELRRKLNRIEENRDAQANRRQKAFHISLVGYTNAGKSTLTNALTKADVLVADQLFATLDSTTRQLFLEPGKTVILSDTVGFIRKLPHHLVASFKSTLAVVRQADLVLHVVDCSGPELMQHLEVTESVLRELIDEDKSRILVMNKADALDAMQIESIKHSYPDAILVSATQKIGLDELRQTLLRRCELWEDGMRRESSKKKPAFSNDEEIYFEDQL